MVPRLIERHLGLTPLGIRQTESPDAWFVDLSEERTVVLMRPGWRTRPGSPEVEAWIYRQCERHGIRVPRVLAVADDPECLILQRLGGRPLSADAATELAMWARAGEELRALHQIRMPSFGPLAPGPDSPHGEATRWCPFATYARTEGIPWLVDAGYLGSSEADGLTRRFDEAASVFSQVTEGRLLHGDLCSGHIFHSDRTYEGMLDFGQAQSGDPRWDIARVPLQNGRDAQDALLAGYGGDAATREDRDSRPPRLITCSWAASCASMPST